MRMTAPVIDVRPLTAERWDDFVTVFGPSGGTDGCWCMWFRQTGDEYRAGRGDRNRSAFEAIVRSGAVPGLLAYVDGEAAAWCAVQPRPAFKRLGRSRLTKSPDGAEAWAIVCFVTRPQFRGRGLSRVLVDAAVAFAAEHGARLVEAFPVEAAGRVDAAAGFHGFASTFRAAGFSEVERRAERRPYMRRQIG
jgi:GNAT superfamily N-acetyltransferase